jgi:signal transduction histidine kinase
MPETRTSRSWPDRLLVRGESALAWAGLAGALLIVGVLALSAAWTSYATARARETERAEQVRSVATLLVMSAESMLAKPAEDDPAASSDLSGLRRLMVETAINYRLSAATLVLPDGAILADADPKRSTLRAIPNDWPATGPAPAAASPADASAQAESAGRLALSLSIPGRGPAELRLAWAPLSVGWLVWEVLAGVGAIAVLGLVGVLLAYRAMRSRLRALLAVREALAALAKGETASAALSLSGSLGPEAQAWNTLLEQRESQRQRRIADRLSGQAAPAPSQTGELAGACDVLWHGLILIDEHLRVKYLNGAAAAFLGSARDGALGKPADALALDPRVLEAVRATVTGTLRARSVIEVGSPADAPEAGPALASPERRGNARRPGGVLRFSVRPARREDLASAVVLVEDITQQRVADEARNAFVAQATHELRTPLTNIRLYVEQLIDDPAADAQQRAQALNVINQEARRLERIVGDMLSVSEIEAGTMRLHRDDVRVAGLIDEMRADFEAQAKAKDIRLEWDISPKLPVLQGDRDKITLALHNLLGNAIKYTPAGGTVRLRADQVREDLVVDIIDTGIGIRPEEHELIFDRFYRAKDQRLASITGSGLGLALAREVARLHGGDITVQSQIDKGSTFSLTLPITAPQSQAAAA